MDYQQLMITDEGSISAEQRQFVALHKEIVYSGNIAATACLRMAEKLKEMRDGKVYAAAGFETFEDYTETALGIKERQAYNYIKAVEGLSKEFLQSNAKLGITKLVMLAGVSESVREEIVESSDIEELSVRELKEIIAELEAEKAQMQMSMDDIISASVQADKSKFEQDVEIEKKKAAKEIEAQAKKVKQLEKDKFVLETAIENLKNQPKEIETVADPETEKRLAAATRELESKTAELDALNKKLAIESDPAVTEFKIKFKDFQRVGLDLLSLLQQMGEESSAKCKTALKTIVEGWKL